MEKVSKTKFFCECFFEKCMEWIEFLRNGIIKRDQWISNLSEHYCIYKDYMCKEFEIVETVGGQVIVKTTDKFEFSKANITNRIVFDNVTDIEILTHHDI